MSDLVEVLGRHPDVASVRAVLLPSGGASYEVTPAPTIRAPGYGLFYFSDQDGPEGRQDYSVCLAGAEKADRLGLDAVWTPERHFTGVGAASPSPSVFSAALAMVTKQIALRAGSVVLPLHHPVRVAEEWAMVDRLSGGRVGVSFASGWLPDDFVFAPDLYVSRRDVMADTIRQVRALWSGEAVNLRNGLGQTASIRIRPRPLQNEIPIWLTAAATPDTFALAGKLGVNVLTALLQLSVDQVIDNIGVYRSARADAGWNVSTGNVTVMMHTYLLPDAHEAEKEARPALRGYFAAQTALRQSAAKSAGRKVGDNAQISDRMLDHSVDKYLREKCLIGSPSSVQPIIQKLISAGASEFASLIDFGIESSRTVAAIDGIADLKMWPYRALEKRLIDTVGTPCDIRVVPPSRRSMERSSD